MLDFSKYCYVLPCENGKREGRRKDSDSSRGKSTDISNLFILVVTCLYVPFAHVHVIIFPLLYV